MILSSKFHHFPSFLILTVSCFFCSSASSLQAQTTNVLLNLSFNDTNASYPAWGSTALTGSPGAGVSSLKPTTSNSGLFPTAPTSGYLVLAPNASAVNSNTYWNGWAANTTLATVNSPYAAGGLGQTNLSKISLTAKVRVRGMPANGAVVILKLQASGDNPNSVPGGYKRVMFEPVFLANNDWTTIGGTLDDASLITTTAQGTRYNFTGFTNSASFQVLVELSGFNRFGTTGYTAYANNPTAPASGGRKNPGFDLSANNIRVEVDDVKLAVVDPATNGLISATTPSQLLRNPNFSGGTGYWTFFEGAYYNSTEAWGETNTFNFACIPGWAGLPYAGFMQNQIGFSATNGSFFTLTFRGKFEKSYAAGQTLVTFMNGNDTQNFKAVDINDQVAANLGQWATYTVRYNASASDLSAMNGNMSIKVQPLDRTVGAQEASAILDDFVLAQQQASAVGPQIGVKIAGKTFNDGQTNTLAAPLIGYTTTYPVVLSNEGAEPLTISSVNLSGTSLSLIGAGSSVTLQPGETKTYPITTLPSADTALSGTLTINSNDKDTADQVFVVNLQTTPVLASEDYNSSTPSQLGWTSFYSTPSSFDTAASVTVANGTLKLDVDSFTGAGVYPWYYGIKKPFASPGTLDLSRSTLTASLRATGVFSGASSNKVQVYLESLSSSGAATGRLSLGQRVDETTTGATPGSTAYFTPDGTNDRVVVFLPEGGGFTSTGGSLASAVNDGFKADAPAFQLVVVMTDFEFDLDAGNIVEIDSLNLNLVTKGFELSNGGFESNTTDFAAGAAPSGWVQYPVEGVSKNLVTNGVAVYNASTGLEDATTPFAAYSGTKAMKIYGQNYYSGGIWMGPSQTGTVYQEWNVAGTSGLASGQAIHARGAAKVFGIDPLTGGSTFKYGFRYMDANNLPVGPDDVTTLTASTDVPDQWVALVANGTIPAGAAKVQLIAEFVQNASTDGGAVYLDDLSIGFDTVAPTATVGSSTYSLIWSDEFNGSALNSGNWVAETGRGPNNDGWGNNEAQTYTTDTANLRVENGSLILQAVKSGSSWTSARIKSQGLRSFKYGKIEFRAKLPSGVGPWPAAWMMGTNIASVGWPSCGEIDVMEWRGNPTSDANTVGHALHSPTRNGGNPVEPASRSAVTNPSGAFHTYAVVWTSNNMVFSVDGVDKATLTPPSADATAFRQEFFLLLNLAMGGNYVGNTIDASLTSATYEVDYVRVYQAQSSVAPADTTPPVITLSGANPVSVNWGATYSDAGATAFDAGDNASVGVITNNPVNIGVPGTYLVTYTATDSKSNTASTNRTVNVTMTNSGTNRGADGLTDVLRYAFGGTGTNSIPSTLLPSNTVSGGNLVLTYYARTNANVVLEPVVSTNLTNVGSWTNGGITVTTLTNVSTNGTTLEKRQATTPASGSKKFLRLKATYTP